MFADVLDRAAEAAVALSGQERVDAERLIALCRELEASPRDDVKPGDVESTPLSRELGALVEVLARRSARAMPMAALGRAALAHVRGADADSRALVREASDKLALFGF